MSNGTEGQGAIVKEPSIRLIVSNSHSLLCDAVKLALERESDLEVVAEAADGSQAVAAAGGTQPDVVLLDISMPGCAVRTIGFVKQGAPGCRVLLLADAKDGKLLTDGLEAGANGFLSKDQSLSELIAAVRSVNCGETFVASSMVDTLVGELIRRRNDRGEALRRTAQLTAREKEVLAQVARGRSTTAIAEDLVISPHTARTHIQNVLGKLDVHSRLEAATLIMDNDILEELTDGDR